jgi:hypothetical protein
MALKKTKNGVLRFSVIWDATLSIIIVLLSIRFQQFSILKLDFYFLTMPVSAWCYKPRFVNHFTLLKAAFYHPFG